MKNFKLHFLFLFFFTTPYLFSQEVYKNDFGNFEITIPVGWKQIPNTVLNNLNKKAKSILGENQTNKYTVGFQKKLSNTYITFPYCIIEMNKAGKISESELKKFSKELDDVLDKVMTKHDKLKKYIKNLKVNEKYYDEENTRIVSSVEMKANNKNVTGLMIMKLTSYGSVNMYFCSTTSTWEKYYPEFIDFADNLKIDPKYEYIINKEKDVKKTQVKDSIKMKENKSDGFNFMYNIIFPLLNYIIYITPVIISLLLLNKRKQNFHRLLRQINTYKWLISTILCIILFILQYLITEYLIVPLILNSISIYPLALLMSHVGKSDLESNENISPNDTNSFEVHKEASDNCAENITNNASTEITQNVNNKGKDNNKLISEKIYPEDLNLLETQEQLEKYAKVNWKYFKEISMKYEQSNPEYFKTTVKPVMEKYSYLDEIIKEREKVQSGTVNPDEPYGIGGWLILPVIYILWGILSSFFAIIEYQSLSNKFSGQSIKSLRNKFSDIIAFGTIKNIIVIALLTIIAFYFFMKKKQTPRLMIGFLILSVFLNFIEGSIISSAIIINYSEFTIIIIWSVIVAVFYGIYFSVSKRVKNTFIN